MGRNSLAPGFVRLIYTANGRVHKATLPVEPVNNAGVWAVEKNNGTLYSPWTGAVDAYVTVFKALLNTSDEVQTAQLWVQVDEDSEPVFEEEHNIATAGTNATSPLAYGQCTMVFRTDFGGLLRLYVMEPAVSLNQHFFPPLSAGPFENLRAHVAGATTGWFRGRDGGVPTSLCSVTTKINDKLRKKFLLNA